MQYALFGAHSRVERQYALFGKPYVPMHSTCINAVRPLRCVLYTYHAIRQAALLLYTLPGYHP